jgi:hypothetical protein
MKEFISKELLFFFIALIVSIPVAVLFLGMMDDSESSASTNDEGVFELQLMVLGSLLGFVGVYLIRLIVWAIKTILNK